MDISDSSSSNPQENATERTKRTGGAPRASESRRQRLAHIRSQMEAIKLWSDAQIHTLQAGLYSRIAELEAEIHALESRSPEEGDYDDSDAIAWKLQELADRGDAVYDLLVSMLPEGVRSQTPSDAMASNGEAGAYFSRVITATTLEPVESPPEHPVAGPLEPSP
jgi:hypothetical protein